MKRKIVLIASLLILSVFLASCKDKKEEIPEAENSMKVLVEEVFEETFLAKSLDANYNGKVMVPNRAENDASLNVWPGDEVKVYYDGGISESHPARITKVKHIEMIKRSTEKNTDEDDKDKIQNGSDSDKENVGTSGNSEKGDSEKGNSVNSEGKKKNKYYDYPILEVNNNGANKKLKDNESALIHQLVDTVEWEYGTKDIKPDYILTDDSNRNLEFDSETGILNDKSNDIHTKLHKELKELLLLTLNGEL